MTRLPKLKISWRRGKQYTSPVTMGETHNNYYSKYRYWDHSYSHNCNASLNLTYDFGCPMWQISPNASLNLTYDFGWPMWQISPNASLNLIYDFGCPMWQTTPSLWLIMCILALSCNCPSNQPNPQLRCDLTVSDTWWYQFFCVVIE